MSSFTALFAALALVFGPTVPAPSDVPPGVDGTAPAVDATVLSPTAEQVRIEQHVIWRISPMPGPARESLMAIAPRDQSAPRITERRMDKCIPMNWIAGGQPQAGSRLLLFLRDRRMIAADLEKACTARDFYSGFYVDKPDADGRLCAGRDRILARSGARCSISSFRMLVADD